MGLFVVNFIFGFSAFFLFLAAFGTMLGLIGVGALVFCVYALLNYFVQQSWLALIRVTLIAEVVKCFIISGAKKAISYISSALPSFSRKRKQNTLNLLLYA